MKHAYDVPVCGRVAAWPRSNTSVIGERTNERRSSKCSFARSLTHSLPAPSRLALQSQRLNSSRSFVRLFNLLGVVSNSPTY